MGDVSYAGWEMRSLYNDTITKLSTFFTAVEAPVKKLSEIMNRCAGRSDFE